MTSPAGSHLPIQELINQLNRLEVCNWIWEAPEATFLYTNTAICICVIRLDSLEQNNERLPRALVRSLGRLGHA